MAACEYFAKLNSALFLNWACYNIYMNLDGSTTIIVDAEMMVEWVYTVLYSRMFFGKYHLLAYTFD